MGGYEIGKKVIAICNHPSGMFQKGDIFPLYDISTMPCCKMVILDIGIKRITATMDCLCGAQHVRRGEDVWWFSAKRFIPLEENEFKHITYTKIIEDTPVGAN